jgi:hypothetical protein
MVSPNKNFSDFSFFNEAQKAPAPLNKPPLPATVKIKQTNMNVKVQI